MNLASCAVPKVRVTWLEAFSDSGKPCCLQDGFPQWRQNWKLHWLGQRTLSWEIGMLHEPQQRKLQVLKHIPSKHMSQVDFSLCQTVFTVIINSGSGTCNNWLWDGKQNYFFYAKCSGILCYRNIKLSGIISISCMPSSQDWFLTTRIYPNRRRNIKDQPSQLNPFFRKQ